MCDSGSTQAAKAEVCNQKVVVAKIREGEMFVIQSKTEITLVLHSLTESGPTQLQTQSAPLNNSTFIKLTL